MTEQGSLEVLAAIVVDERYFSLVDFLDFAGGNDPTERVVEFAQESGQFAVEGLPGHLDVLIVEIDAQVNIVLIII
jgi:hypothetical protein